MSVLHHREFLRSGSRAKYPTGIQLAIDVTGGGPLGYLSEARDVLELDGDP